MASLIGMLARFAFGMPGWPNGKPKSHAEIITGIDAAFDLFEQGLSEYGLHNKPRK